VLITHPIQYFKPVFQALAQGEAVELLVDAYPRRPVPARVRLIAPESVVVQNVTSFQVRLSLPKEGGPKLMSGMNFTANFLVGRHGDALLVPTSAIVSQEGGDPAAVSYDAVCAGKARKKDVVLIDTAGRLPTQMHLMEELKKMQRVVAKAGAVSGLENCPREVLLVIDGNTGQNALAQVRAFDDALGLTGLIITKLDGTAKGGVLAAIARERPIPVYFIGLGEKLEELETFNAREFAQALLQ
jgi:hypothetical protein